MQKAREFIQGKEGLYLYAYDDKDGHWPHPEVKSGDKVRGTLTIGYGHTKGVKAGDRITKEEAENLLFDDFDEHSKALRYVRVPLTENQKIVLSSMAYNMGLPRFINSDFVKILNSGDYEGAANEFEKYVRNDAGIIQPGLVKRRAEEKKLFLTPD